MNRRHGAFTIALSCLTAPRCSSLDRSMSKSLIAMDGTDYSRTRRGASISCAAGKTTFQRLCATLWQTSSTTRSARGRSTLYRSWRHGCRVNVESPFWEMRHMPSPPDRTGCDSGDGGYLHLRPCPSCLWKTGSDCHCVCVENMAPSPDKNGSIDCWSSMSRSLRGVCLSCQTEMMLKTRALSRTSLNWNGCTRST